MVPGRLEYNLGMGSSGNHCILRIGEPSSSEQDEILLGAVLLAGSISLFYT